MCNLNMWAYVHSFFLRKFGEISFKQESPFIGGKWNYIFFLFKFTSWGVTQSVYTATTRKLTPNNGTRRLYVRTYKHPHTYTHRQRVYECVFFVYFFYLIIFLVFDGRDAVFIQSDCLRVNIFRTTDCIRASAWRSNRWDAMFLNVVLSAESWAAVATTPI